MNSINAFNNLGSIYNASLSNARTGVESREAEPQQQDLVSIGQSADDLPSGNIASQTSIGQVESGREEAPAPNANAVSAQTQSAPESASQFQGFIMGSRAEAPVQCSNLGTIAIFDEPSVQDMQEVGGISPQTLAQGQSNTLALVNVNSLESVLANNNFLSVNY